MIAEAVGYLGPATVLVEPEEPNYVQIVLAGNTHVVRARLAMAVPYRPQAGDEVLVIFNDRAQAYVIGVLQGSGVTTLRMPYDLRLEAPGRVQIVAGKQIEIRSRTALQLDAPRATFRFARMNVLATTVVQRLTNAFTWATGLVQSKSQRLRCVVDDGWLVRAGRAHVKTTENIHINGKTVHLG